MIILRDITERKLLEVERSQSHDLLEQRVNERTAELVMANEKLNAEVDQRRHAELEKEKQRSEMEILYTLTFELAAMPLDADLEGMVTKRMKELTGAFIATVSEYNPVKKQLELRRIETESSALKEANRLMKRRVTELNFPVSDAMYQEMVNAVVGHRNTLSEATFGSIPPAISTILQNIFNLESFIGMAIQYEGELMGTMMIVIATWTAYYHRTGWSLLWRMFYRSFTDVNGLKLKGLKAKIAFVPWQRCCRKQFMNVICQVSSLTSIGRHSKCSVLRKLSQVWMYSI